MAPFKGASPCPPWIEPSSTIRIPSDAVYNLIQANEITNEELTQLDSEEAKPRLVDITATLGIKTPNNVPFVPLKYPSMEFMYVVIYFSYPKCRCRWTG